MVASIQIFFSIMAETSGEEELLGIERENFNLPQIPDALSRPEVVGRHLLRKAKEWGWTDDGEGAFEYVQRISYQQGLEDGLKGYKRSVSEHSS